MEVCIYGYGDENGDDTLILCCRVESVMQGLAIAHGAIGQTNVRYVTLDDGKTLSYLSEHGPNR